MKELRFERKSFRKRRFDNYGGSATSRGGRGGTNEEWGEEKGQVDSEIRLEKKKHTRCDGRKAGWFLWSPVPKGIREKVGT